MKARMAAVISAVVALLEIATYVPDTKAGEPLSGIPFRYRFVAGEVRHYRYTMTILDSDGSNIELIMSQTAMVTEVRPDGSARVEVKLELVSFRADTEKQSVKLMPGKGTSPRPGSTEAHAEQVINDHLCGTRSFEVNSLGQVGRSERRNHISGWGLSIQDNPDIFCSLLTATVFENPPRHVMPFWVQYPEKATDVGDIWPASPESEERFENLACTWVLKEMNGTSATLEQIFGECMLSLAFSGLMRLEKSDSRATFTVDLETGWISRYESTTSVSAEMTYRDPNTLAQKSKRSVDSTVTTILELLRP